MANGVTLHRHRQINLYDFFECVFDVIIVVVTFSHVVLCPIQTYSYSSLDQIKYNSSNVGSSFQIIT